ncbi:hypothetical protein B0H63DRAFT_421762 [Podospora didyma]|uniref:Fe2OG dioxygenase domain-containing protein n=1 Tax=Podospora didyma TaxID=330526 RepID=A0AAE0K5J7_9PEZI|nr:hypothetical protein B0H63DRAFT_421762 [Podospora didyma]
MVNQDPVVVRWDSGKPEANQTLRANLPVADEQASQDAFAQLLAACQPATFGKGGEKVLEESYRKAGKMDASQFSTNFNPYEHGIIDTLAQALVRGEYYPGIRAELYNLNIYSGPSGKFKPHVDTPLSKDQMGSLVVCLPYAYMGGRLAVRHAGREVFFNWATETPTTIEWAAFFSDCEHEVYEVTSGHRLMLTYNLYWANPGPTNMADDLDAINPSSIYFFDALHDLINCPQFLPTGGRLGFTCTHAYPHATNSSARNENIHRTLKGVDMLVYQALKRLTNSVQVTSVLDDEEYQYQQHIWESDDDEEGDDGTNDGEEDEDIATCQTTVYVQKSLATARPVLHHEDLRHYERYPDPAAFTNFQRQKVMWLNWAPDHTYPRELAAAFIAYGNEPTLKAYYSTLGNHCRTQARVGMSDTNSGCVQTFRAH